jgi:hypothetical protein
MFRKIGALTSNASKIGAVPVLIADDLSRRTLVPRPMMFLVRIDRTSALGPIVLKKSFLTAERKARTTGASFAQRREGPHRFTQKRPQTVVSILESVAAAEPSTSARFSRLLDFRLLQQYRSKS